MSSPSIICKNFSQNAWKKDLCSNCFKSEVEHWDNANGNVNKSHVNENGSPKMTNNSIIVNGNGNGNNDCVNILNGNHSSINSVSINVMSPPVSCTDKKPLMGVSSKLSNGTSQQIIPNKTVTHQSSWKRRMSNVETNDDNHQQTNGKLSNKKGYHNGVTRERSASLPPIIGILKTSVSKSSIDNNDQIIRFKPRAKSLGFKEGEPLIIGFIEDYTEEDEDVDNGYDGSDSTDDEDDTDGYTGDDDTLKELTRINTKFNSQIGVNLPLNNAATKSVENGSETVEESDESSDESSDGANSEMIIKDVTESQILNDESIKCNWISGNNRGDGNGDDVVNDIYENGSDIKDDDQNINNHDDDAPPMDSCDKIDDDLIMPEEYLKTNVIYSPGGDLYVSSPSASSSSSSSSSASSVSSITTDDSAADNDTECGNDAEKCTQILCNDNDQFKKSETITISVETNEYKCPQNIIESDNKITADDVKPPQAIVRQKPIREKPILPAKPNILSLPPKPKIIIDNIKSNYGQISVPSSLASAVSSSVASSVTSVSSSASEGSENEYTVKDESNVRNYRTVRFEHIYQEIENDDVIVVDESGHKSDEKLITKRELKLAELAHELEMVRHSGKRPAPQPPQPPQSESAAVTKSDDIGSHQMPVQRPNNLQLVNNDNKLSKTKFSIKKLLHLKSMLSGNGNGGISTSVGSYVNHSADYDILSISSQETPSPSSGSVNPKAWKNAEFNRSNIKIIHPNDLPQENGKNENEQNPECNYEGNYEHNYEHIKESESSIVLKVESPITPELPPRPPAPPRTPKVQRPVVPARTRRASTGITKTSAAPPMGPPPPPSALNIYGSLNTPLMVAYEHLSKLTHESLISISRRIESRINCNGNQWSDFEIGTGERIGDAIVYRDAISSHNGRVVNLVVASYCYHPPFVAHFHHHQEHVFVFDNKWSDYHTLSELNISNLQQKQINSLIVQLFTILESLEISGIKEISSLIYDTILICSSPDDDVIMLIPDRTLESSDNTNDTKVPLFKFLTSVLEKLLPLSLFYSIAHILCHPRSISMSQSMSILHLIAFQVPTEEMTSESKLRFWFDHQRGKFLRQYLDDRFHHLSQLDYAYLRFLVHSNHRSVRDALSMMLMGTIGENSSVRL